MLNITICDGNSVQSEMIQAEIDRSLDSQISYNLQVFHDGKLFEHEITSRNCPYDIVILDIELGNSSKSGIELAREINCLNPETQIIFVSQSLEYAPDVYACRHTYFISRDRISELMESALNISLENLYTRSGSLDAEITDEAFRRYYYTGNFPKLSKELRECVIAESLLQENGILIKHIPVRGGHLFWTEDISVLLDQYQDIQEQQEELTARNQLLQMTYQKEAARRKLEEQNHLMNMIQDQTYRQYELLSLYMKKFEQTDSREECDMLLSKIVVVGTYLKRRKNLVLTRYSSQGDFLTMADLKQSLAESCENLKLCKIRAAYFVQDKENLLHADDVLRCYDFFEWLIEQLFDVVSAVFFRVTQIEEKLQISVHVICLTDIRIFLAERPDLLIQQEEEQEWFIRCPVS